ncbi:DUF1992 domain-containing protein [Kitasatospora phosalacinea]|uniref:DUF1992 domain-containing protein n=1 Tax=Kitasatospora phosalacinea TaxID=2065 RepID=UPI0005261597|nr:DUF1992 domain-containing protein [Kitasatospora phosalacinea]
MTERETAGRAAFDGLPGAGEPLPGEGRPCHEPWWTGARAERAALPHPPPPALRAELRAALDTARLAPAGPLPPGRRAEADARIAAALRRPARVDVHVESVVAEWRDARS